MNFSQTQLTNYVKIITGIIMFALPMFGMVADEAQVAFIVFAVITTGASIYSFYQRFMKGDLTIGGFRK